MTADHCIIHRALDAATLAQDLADVVADQLRDGLARRGQALLIVSGGNTPVPFFERLSLAELAWSQVSVTLADERWVPPSHADSNARLVQRHLLQGPAAQARWLPLVNKAATPAEGQPALEHALADLPWPADVLVFTDYELQKAFAGVSSHECQVLVPIFDNDQDIACLAAKVQPWLDEHPDCVGYLIRGHGLYTWGATMADCLRQVEAFEFLFECELKVRALQR